MKGVRSRTRSRSIRAAVLTMLTCAPVGGSAQEAVEAEIRQRVERLSAAGSVELAGESVVATPALISFYQRTGFSPVWDSRSRQRLRQALLDLRRDGLDPAHYHLSAIDALSAADGSPGVLADLDLLQSNALLAAGHDLRFGRVVAESPGLRWSLWAAGSLEDDWLDRAARAPDVGDELERMRPPHPAYRGMVAALSELRRIQSAGGWPRILGGEPLKRDSQDPRVALLRNRLHIQGFGPAALSGEPPFDAETETAVRRFQRMHGLNDDGVVGPATLAELNVTVEGRIEQLRANLERTRWIPRSLPSTYLVVNIAGATVHLVRNGVVLHQARAIVGAIDTRTPVFTASLTHLEINPTWTVPPGIVGEILTNVRKDPDYLASQRIRVLDQAGRPQDAASIDFTRYTGRTFPFVFRQDAGPMNPLGQIKFVFPNPHHVYIHDTPNRELFDREGRTFSHGCIRVQDPLSLAVRVLDDPASWSRDSLESIVSSTRTHVVPMRAPLPVFVLYWTAFTDDSGELHFLRDVYERDPGILRELNRR